jgi:NAD(P)-dependent dehydrogenase (short-subunit alcohol dehydrogenase family)
MCTAVMHSLGGEKASLDVLVNCAGVIFDGDVENTYPQDYDYIVDLNLRAAFHITSLLSGFLEKAHGCVVNVSACFGSRPQTGCVSYCMSKAGLEMLTKCCALELAPQGVRVNAVAPGTTDTNLLRYVGYSESEYEAFKDRVSPAIPLQRIANPAEIARAIIFLCSEKYPQFALP